MASRAKAFVAAVGIATAEGAAEGASNSFFESAGEEGTTKEQYHVTTTGDSREPPADGVSGAGEASLTDWVLEGMAEAVVFAAAWFTARMVCTRGYNAIKTFRMRKRKGQPPPKEKTGFTPAYQAAGKKKEGSSVPWGPAPEEVNEGPDQGPTSLSREDRRWIQNLHSAASASTTRSNLRLLQEMQDLGGKIDSLALEELHRKLRLAIKLLTEYQQNPGHRTARRALEQAEEAATEVYSNDMSLAMSLSALRIRIVITYLNPPRHSAGLEPSLEERQSDKYQCELYIRNALKHNSLVVLSRAFVASRNSEDKKQRERVGQETVVAFDMILEVIASVYILEPFEPSQGIIPAGAPEVVLHALAMYCQSRLGASPLYEELVLALQDWQSKPQRQEKLALHCLYRSTNGGGWACSKGWDNLFEVNTSSLYGVTCEGGRVTKICLGANNLDGKLPPQLKALRHLQELALPANKLCGKIPEVLWELPCLEVVALQDNFFTVPPPEKFAPASRMPRPSDEGMAIYQRPATGRRVCVAGLVEACHPERLRVYSEEWFTCSWKITNIGGVAFSKGTTLSRVGDERSPIGGVKAVMVNELRPGEEQTVSVMQQAPNGVELFFQDEWALRGQGLDFVDDIDATSESPLISVASRESGVGRSAGQHSNLPTLANTVFVSGRHRPGSPQRPSFAFDS